MAIAKKTKKKPDLCDRIERKKDAFAKKCAKAWRNTEKFVTRHCKDESKRERYLSDLCRCIDAWIGVNVEMTHYCYKNGVDLNEFVCDVNNKNWD